MPEWDGAAYARVNGLQEALAARALAAVALRGDEDVLDVGCGDGRVTLALADRLTTGTVLGVDPSESMLAVARERAAGRADVTFRAGRAEDLDPGAGHDVVVSFNALHWATDPAEALARVAAAVAPGGALLLQLVGGGGRPSLEATAAAVLDTPRWAGRAAPTTGPRFWHPPPGAVAVALGTHGLRVASDVVADESWDFGDRDTFAAWCAVGLAAWLADPADGPAFAADVVDAYAPVSGSASLFRFLQCRVVAHRPG